MGKNEKNGIDFEVGDTLEGKGETPVFNTDPELLIRQSFRIPVEQSDEFNVQINSRSYDLFNLGYEGFCVHVKEEEQFALGQRLDPIRLTFNELSFTVSGIVVHVSPSETGRHLCGIKMIDLDRQTLTGIKEYVQTSRTKLLSEIVKPGS